MVNISQVDEESHLVEALEGIRVLVGESIQIGDAWATIPGARQPTVVKLNIID